MLRKVGKLLIALDSITPIVQLSPKGLFITSVLILRTGSLLVAFTVRDQHDIVMTEIKKSDSSGI